MAMVRWPVQLKVNETAENRFSPFLQADTILCYFNAWAVVNRNLGH
jgi:hypothetical protein